MNFRMILGRLGRLKENSRNNRAYVVAGGRLFLRLSPTIARSLSVAAVSLPPSSRVYCTPLLYLRAHKIPLSQMAIAIPHLGMFGNAVATLIPQLALAFQLKVGNFWVFGDTVFSGEPLRLSGSHTTTGPMLHLGGRNVQTSRIKALIQIPGAPVGVDELSCKLARQSISELLRKTLCPRPAKELDLAIHIRGGDVYRGRRLLTNHGQPPLAYYKTVIESRKWAMVRVVHQGVDIPFLSDLKDYMERENIRFAFHNESLREDLSILLAARNLCVGRGSFGPAVAGISPWIERVFYFENGFGFNCSGHSLETIRVTDLEGLYTKTVLSNNWSNSVSQRQLMLSYPQWALSLQTPNRQTARNE